MKRKDSFSQSYSNEIAPEILMSFMRGSGHIIEGYIFTEHDQRSTSAGIAAAKTTFHTALINHIHGLTGVKPRVAPGASDPNKFAIYYE